MTNKPNPVIHFEMPYEDRDRMTSFYEDAFGWQSNKMGPEMGNYVVVMTSARKSIHERPERPGVIDGGFFEKSAENPHPSVVIEVPDIKAAMEKVRSAGGSIIESTLKNGEPMEIPGIGFYAGALDTEGNRVSILQPSEQ